MIRLRGLRKSYTTNKVVNEVLKGVDLDIEAGEFVAIVGRSGSGKTTMLNVVGALDSQYEGSVEVDGKQLRELDDVSISAYRNQNIGFIFQSFYLLEHMTCIENVALPAVFARGGDAIERSVALERARAVMAEVELSDKCDALPNTLSGGQKQRVAIARALFNRPRLMICDEPTGNLDITTAQSILALFRRLNEEQDITLVIVTHDHMISQACKRIVHIDQGQIVEGAGEFQHPTGDAAGDAAGDTAGTTEAHSA
ncbi:Cell division transporter, ATP-binding protein FtsE [Enhygromyxa salina]|uniref:Cell division transporter, ATP-binding protein FtsE n=1 Tax=Enhygromyxa salina TaxID=215803 RepID=A0A0C1ZUY3_9BACT|nr:ABC transporter ATP-binding protein [Enhygromyxa salina]KIG14878.1 Cell division transporter, ATP-binding protein FtsE [Enhygromyxa salina]